MIGKVRFIAALLLAKALRRAMRILRRNATYLPGKAALRLCPDYMRRIRKPARVVAVTGTNGKTTVSNLICDVLAARGYKVLSNRLGSNVTAGIAACLTNGVDIFGRPKYPIAVLETDERSAHRIFPFVRPQLMVITNLFRDSPMRNAHPAYIADFLTRYIPADTRLILNADDLISGGVAPSNPRVYFGIERMETDVTQCVNLIDDLRVCPRCQEELVYEYRRYHHIGRACCAACGLRSPEYDYYARDVDTAGMTMTVGDGEGTAVFKLLSDSVFNIYNLLTVTAALRELGLPLETVRDELSKTGIVESRFNTVREGGVEIIMQMSKDKNALAGSRAFDYIAGLPGDKEMILMMNCLHDQKSWSENVTWLYDCDFEFLNRENITRIVATGPRAKDYILRLLIAGVPAERLRLAERELDAPRELALREGTSVCVFYGTDAIGLAYAVRNEVRRLAREGAAQ